MFFRRRGLYWLRGISDQKRHVEKRLIKEQRGANVELGRECFLDEGGCVRESEKGGIEVVESVIEGKAYCHLCLDKQVEKGDQKVGSAINV